MCLLCSKIYLEFNYFFWTEGQSKSNRHLAGVVFISTAIVDRSFLHSVVLPWYYDCTAGQTGRLQDVDRNIWHQERRKRIDLDVDE